MNFLFECTIKGEIKQKYNLEFDLQPPDRNGFCSENMPYKMFFNEDLKLKGIKECPWNDVGSCDYDIIDNFINIIGDDSQNKFGMSPVMYSAQNGHLEILQKF